MWAGVLIVFALTSIALIVFLNEGGQMKHTLNILIQWGFLLTLGSLTFWASSIKIFSNKAKFFYNVFLFVFIPIVIGYLLNAIILMIIDISDVYHKDYPAYKSLYEGLRFSTNFLVISGIVLFFMVVGTLIFKTGIIRKLFSYKITLVKKTTTLVVVAILGVSAMSCSRSSHNHRAMGITAITPIEGKYYVISFNNKCTSYAIESVLKKEGYVCVKMSELDTLISHLPNKAKKHAGIYGMKEYGKDATKILKEISKVEIAQPEVYSPFFHFQNKKLIADWGDFMQDWSSYGYLVVSKTTTERRR